MELAPTRVNLVSRRSPIIVNAVLPTVRLLSCQFFNFFVKILFNQQGQGVYLTLKNLLKQSTISNQMLG